MGSCRNERGLPPGNIALMKREWFDSGEIFTDRPARVEWMLTVLLLSHGCETNSSNDQNFLGIICQRKFFKNSSLIFPVELFRYISKFWESENVVFIKRINQGPKRYLKPLHCGVPNEIRLTSIHAVLSSKDSEGFKTLTTFVSPLPFCTKGLNLLFHPWINLIHGAVGFFCLAWFMRPEVNWFTSVIEFCGGKKLIENYIFFFVRVLVKWLNRKDDSVLESY